MTPAMRPTPPSSSCRGAEEQWQRSLCQELRNTQLGCEESPRAPTHVLVYSGLSRTLTYTRGWQVCSFQTARPACVLLTMVKVP